jgi:hypothetical protein
MLAVYVFLLSRASSSCFAEVSGRKYGDLVKKTIYYVSVLTFPSLRRNEITSRSVAIHIRPIRSHSSLAQDTTWHTLYARDRTFERLRKSQSTKHAYRFFKFRVPFFPSPPHIPEYAYARAQKPFPRLSKL